MEMWTHQSLNLGFRHTNTKWTRPINLRRLAKVHPGNQHSCRHECQ